LILSAAETGAGERKEHEIDMIAIKARRYLISFFI
jgi:hypothetical protein